MQQLTIAGNVGRQPELRTTQGGDNVLGFSIAVDNGKDSSGNKRPPTWFDCAVWGKRATSLQPHIRKGSKLVLSGRPTARAHEGKAYMGISVDQISFMGDSDQAQQSPQQSPASSGYDDDLPF